MTDRETSGGAPSHREGASSRDNIGGVTIGVPEIYRVVQDLGLLLARLDGRVETALARQALQIETITHGDVERDGRITDHEHRIRILEQRPVVTPRAVWTATSVIVGIFTVLIGIIALVLQR